MEKIIPQNLNEILVYDKPRGLSSYDVIRKVKREYPRHTKIGHSGTLDPFATGVLVVLVGKATKMQSNIMQLPKVYRVVARFNIATDTYDSEGKEVNRDDKVVGNEEIIECINSNFMGDIMQTPPNFSAVHVNGRRAYDLAREGVEFKLAPKQVHISRFELLEYSWPNVTFEIECGSGTYIRSLVNDLAIKLGTYAHCLELQRVSVGQYHVDNAIKIENIERSSNEG